MHSLFLYSFPLNPYKSNVKKSTARIAPRQMAYDICPEFKYTRNAANFRFRYNFTFTKTERNQSMVLR